MQFILFIDDVGAEFTKARVTRKEVVALHDWTPIRFRPIDVRPVEVIDESGAARRAAGGFLLLGPLGAALGVILGKGPKVLFELVMADGSTRRGVVAQSDYPRLRKGIAAIQGYKPGQLRKSVGSVLALLVLLPVLVGLGPVGSAVLIGLAVAVSTIVRSLRGRKRQAAS